MAKSSDDIELKNQVNNSLTGGTTIDLNSIKPIVTSEGTDTGTTVTSGIKVVTSGNTSKIENTQGNDTDIKVFKKEFDVLNEDDFIAIASSSASQKSMIEKLQKSISELNNKIKELSESNFVLSNENENLKTTNSQFQVLIATQNLTIENQNNKLNELTSLNSSLTQENTNQKYLIEQQTTRISELSTPYFNEIEFLNKYNELSLNLFYTIDNIKNIINNMNLDNNMQVLLSNVNTYLLSNILNSFSDNFNKINDTLSIQNDIENKKFSIIENTVSQIDLNNIDAFLISKSSNIKLDIKNVIKQFDQYSIIELLPDVIESLDRDYLLYFTNSVYLYKNVGVRHYKFSNTFDVVLFKNVERNNLINQKIIFKNKENKIVGESIIFNDTQIDEHKLLFINKLSENISIEYADIVQYEIDDFYIPLHISDTDIDTVQQLLIGKRVYDKTETKYTYYESDDTTTIKVVREYLDPKENKQIRIPTEN